MFKIDEKKIFDPMLPSFYLYYDIIDSIFEELENEIETLFFKEN
jgi:hypothetical protein